MVSMLYDVLELKKVLPFRQNFLFFLGVFVFVRLCDPDGVGGGGSVLAVRR